MARHDKLTRLRAERDAAAARLRDVSASVLDVFARETEDPRYRTAAAMLRGHPAGRTAKDDSEILSYAERLLETGISRSAHDAARMAAMLYAPAHYLNATTDRVRKKLRSKLVKSNERRRS